ncbi:MAG TPA: hypothetical protein PKA30_13100 [Accumulibacter sp.]|uniref:hypothetical protein n=1 Tax=Accumulibacter sp. TaxID=2053492 RepID=UPI0026211005|nr:hypothetical protein [Accumulibacter sp.]MDS4056698.1 hypothetical protein [Accumulibacter sp.]HMV06472.1 hypothetical protein [Accumulibacter sp.]HMW79242.1 hypothetical protein [Accumulibacter sp.]HMX67371.1 hypothetical protein [Accumulibacter sp.]HNB68753.1 hypothetical protein [Accumulibacter sp.]
MNASKPRIARNLVVALVCLSAGAAYAVQNLNAASQTKVNNAMAKAWQKGGNPNDPALQKRVVNIGSKRNNTCNVNVGTAQTGRPGQRAPKDVVVTTKEVINVCK